MYYWVYWEENISLTFEWQAHDYKSTSYWILIVNSIWLVDKAQRGSQEI